MFSSFVHKTEKGMTLVETLVTIAIFSAMMIAVAELFASLYRTNESAMHGGEDALQASRTVGYITDKIRLARQADNGAFPIVSVGGSEIIFYTDVDGDPQTERVRFFRDGDKIKRGVVDPRPGAPPVYDPADETVEDFLLNVRDNPGGKNFLRYYDEGNNLLSSPKAADIKMVEVTVSVDQDPLKAPTAATVSSFSSIRNLREQ